MNGSDSRGGGQSNGGNNGNSFNQEDLSSFLSSTSDLFVDWDGGAGGGAGGGNNVDWDELNNFSGLFGQEIGGGGGS